MFLRKVRDTSAFQAVFDSQVEGDVLWVPQEKKNWGQTKTEAYYDFDLCYVVNHTCQPSGVGRHLLQLQRT